MSLSDLVAADIAAVIDDWDDCTWQPGFGAAVAIKCIFSAWPRTAVDEYGGVVTSGPECLVMTSDVPGIVPGDVMTINEVEYYVKSAGADDLGCRLVELSKDPVK